MLDDMTATIEADAETELELLEGLRVLGRVTALCSELSLDVDAEAPCFFAMSTEARLIGGVNPDGEYPLAMIDGRYRYRVRGRRGTTAYLGFQVLAGVGLTPRRMAAYVSDRDLERARRRHVLVRARGRTNRPPAELAGDTWVAIPEDASAIVVREYIARSRERDRSPTSRSSRSTLPALPPLPTDAVIAEQLTSMAWTIAKLTTLHRTIKPELLDTPNVLVTAEAAQLGAADTTPDNLYMIGTFRLAPDEALVHRVRTARHAVLDRHAREHLARVHRPAPPAQLDHERRRPWPTTAARCGSSIAATDPGVDNWLDTGGRHRGFVTVRWLDNPEAPVVTTRVMPGRERRPLTRLRPCFGHARADRYTAPFAAGWSSLVARRAHNPKVGGSNPPPATM